MLKNKNLLMLAMALTLLGAGGCIFSPEPQPPCTGCGGPEGYQFPDTSDKLMQNFQRAYEEMNFDEFVNQVHPDYITILQESTYNQFPDVGTTLDISEELRIHQRMFSKQDLEDPEGHPVPGVQTISFQTFARQGAWSISPPIDQIPNAEVALYDVVFLFDRGGTNTTLKVQGAIKFYVTHRDSMVSGVPKPYYQMLGQMDLTQDH